MTPLKHSFLMNYRAPARIWSINERLHWSVRASLTQAWRSCSMIETQQFVRHNRLSIPLPSPVRVWMQLNFEDNRKRDAHNYAGTVCKAVVDGLVDAGLVPDDNTDHLHLSEPELVHSPVLPAGVIVGVSWLE